MIFKEVDFIFLANNIPNINEILILVCYYITDSVGLLDVVPWNQTIFKSFLVLES